MKQIARLAVLGAVTIAAVPFASAATIIAGKINTVGNSTYTYPPETFTVSSTGAASLDLTTPGSTVGTNPGLPTGPGPSGSFVAFAAATVTDYSFSTTTISAATPTEILSLNNGTDTVSFFATSTGPYTPTNLPTTEGTLVLYGYLSTTGPDYLPNTFAELDIAANGIGNNFTEDLIANTPEPSSLMLLGTGLVSAGGMMFRRRNVNA